MSPAIKYAREGFEVDAQLQQRRDAAAKNFAGKTDFDASFGNLKQGAAFPQPDLAAVLTRIADEARKISTTARRRT